MRPASRTSEAPETVKALSSGSTWPEWAYVEQRALERQEVAGTSLQDRLLQLLQQAALGQRSEDAVNTVSLHGLRRGLASTARRAMSQV